MGIKFGGWVRITIANILEDLNLVVRYGIAIRICEQEILVVAQAVRQATKFNSPPNFPAIQYVTTELLSNVSHLLLGGLPIIRGKW